MAAAVAVLLMAVAILASGSAIRLGLRAERERGAAEQARLAANSERAAKERSLAAEEDQAAQRRKAEGLLSRMHVANGLGIMDEGDLSGSLVWFAEALRIDAGEPSSELGHRIRLASVFQRCTKPVNIWFEVGIAEFAPEGSRILIVDQTVARVWDAVSGTAVSSPMIHGGEVRHACFSPDGSLVVTCGEDRTARVWDSTTGHPVAPPLRHNYGSVEHASFSLDGRFVVTAGADGTARVWNTLTGIAVTTPLEHSMGVTYAAFSPDGRFIATVSQDWSVQGGEIRVWESATGKPITSPIKPKYRLNHVSFSPDGRLMVIAAGVPDFVSGGRRGGEAQVFHASTGQAVSLPFKHSDAVSHALFSPDGRSVFVVSGSSAWAWDLPYDDRAVVDLLDLAELLTGRFADAAGGSVPVPPERYGKAWQRLQAVYPEEFAQSSAAKIAWHGRQAASYQESDDWYAVAWHLDRLISTSSDTRVSQPVRDRASELARHLRDASTLNQSSWGIVSQVCQPIEQYRRALRLAEAACREESDNGYYLNTLGVAQYRVGQYAESVKTLTRSRELNAKKFGGQSHPADIAFLAMAHHQLGRHDEAQKLLEQLRQLLQDARWKNATEAEGFLREAEELIGSGPPS